jgi:hypothetical protein
MVFIVEHKNESSNLLKIQPYRSSRFKKPYFSPALMVSIRLITTFFIFSVLVGKIPAFGQEESGHVTYDVRFESPELSDEEKALLPTEAHIWFAPGKMKMHMALGPGIGSDVLIRGDEVLVMLDLMGNRMAIRNTRKELESQSSKPFVLRQNLDETRTIANQPCRKAIFAASGENDMVVWYTEKIRLSGNWYYRLQGLDGFPFEFDYKTMDIGLRMVAREFDEMTPPDAVFEPGTDYKIMTQRELEQLLNGTR